MSCEDEHLDSSHDHGNGHNHGHHSHPPHEPELATTPGQTLLQAVEIQRVTAHNAQRPSNAPLVLREYPNRFDLQPGQLQPDWNRTGPDMLLTIPLTAPCKVFSVILRYAPPATTPIKCQFFKNTLPDLQQAAEGAIRPVYESTHPAETAEHCEHHLPRRKFAGTTSLAVYFPDIPEGTALVCVELRGECSKLSKGAVPTGLRVETAPRLEDHIGAGKDKLFSSSLNIQ